MEDNSLPPTQPVRPTGAPSPTQMPGVAAPVSSYSTAQQTYPIESLEVHQEGQQIVAPTYGPTMNSVPFSRRKATVVSLGITLLVILITGAISAFFVRQTIERPSQLGVPTQDASLEDTIESDLPPELQGLEDSLLVNGDIVSRGRLRVVSGNFTSNLSAVTLTGNQTVTLPNASGTLCLDSNNCNFATQAQLAQIQPVTGVTALNGQAGAVAIQGSLNQITVATAGGIITLSTPQALDADANVQFGSLTLSGLGTSNGVLVSGGGNAVALASAGGAGQCLVSTAGAPTFQACPGGSGVNSLNSLTGALTLQGTANQVNVASGGSTITLSTPQDIAATSNVTFNNLTLTGSATIATASVIGNGTDFRPPTPSSGDELMVVQTFNVGADCTFGCAAITASAQKGSATAIFLDAFRGEIRVGAGQGLNTGSGLFIESASLGAGASIVNNYGIFVSNQTVGTNDYGVYIAGADTYALWIDSGISRFDGNLEFEGTTDDAFEFTLTVADPTADRTYTIPNSTAATDTFCFVTLNNCAGTGVSSIGVIDSQTKSANGAVITGTSLVMQSADVTFPGLVSTGSQTFAGAKTFNGQVIASAGINLGTQTLQGTTAVIDFTNFDVASDGDTTIGGTVGIGTAPTATDQLTIQSSAGLGEIYISGNNESSILSDGSLYIGFDENDDCGICEFAIYNDGSTEVFGITGINSRFAGSITTGSALQQGSLVLHDGNGQTATISVGGGLVANTALAIPTAVGVSDTFCLLTLGNCFGSGTGNNLQAAYNAGNTITTTNARDIDITLADTATDPNFLVDIASGSAGRFAVQGNGTDVLSVTSTAVTVNQVLTVTSLSGIDISQQDTSIEFGTGGSKVWGIGPGESNNKLAITYQGTEQFTFANIGYFGIRCCGPTDYPEAMLRLGAINDPFNAWGTNGTQLRVDASTFTDDSTAGAGTATNAVFNSFAQPTLAATNAGVTTTNAATVYIQNAPAAGTNQTITNAYALWVDDGAARFDGNLTVQGNTTLGDASGDTLTLNGTAVSIPNNLNVDGNTFFINSTQNNVGIGTAAPESDSALDIVGRLSATGALELRAGVHTSFITENTPSSFIYSSNSGGSGPFSTAGNLIIQPRSGTSPREIHLATGSSSTLASRLVVDATGQVGVGTTAPDALFEVGNIGRTENAWGLNGIQLQSSASNYTDGSTAASGTATNAVFNSFAQNTLLATNASVTTTNAATLYVEGAPIAGTNQTITNAYALWVDAGISRFDGNVTTAGDTTLGDASGDGLTLNGTNITIPNNLNIDGNTLSINSTNNTLGVRTAATTSAVITIANAASPLELYGTGAGDFDIGSDTDVSIGLDEDNNSSGESFIIYNDGGTNELFSVTESADRGIAYIQGWLRLGVDSVTIPDNGGGTPATLTYEPLASYAEITCNDPNSCDVTMNDSSSSQGQTLFLVSLSASPNTVDLADTAGVQELAGNFIGGQWDTLTMIYATDRWIEYSRSDN